MSNYSKISVANDPRTELHDCEISYACIQVKAGSLGAYTAEDAVIG